MVAFALFAVAFAAPEPKPQFVVPAATAYSAYSAPLPYAGYAGYTGYSAYSALPYASYSGIYPSVYGAGAVVV